MQTMNNDDLLEHDENYENEENDKQYDKNINDGNDR